MKKAAAAYQAVKLRVVDHEKGRFFVTESGLHFDLLPAFEIFEGGKLTVWRDCKIVAETEEIGEYGTHASTLCFIGLHGILDGTPQAVLAYGVDALDPEWFRAGDWLRVSAKVGHPEEFDRHEIRRYESYRKARPELNLPPYVPGLVIQRHLK